MKWFNFETIKNASVYVTPNLPVIATKRYKIGIVKGSIYILLYTFASWLILILILSSTPLKDMLFVVDNTELKAQNERIQNLQKRVIFLTEELQSISSTNEKMKYAIILGQNDSIKSKNPIYDTLKKPIRKKIKIEGNIFGVFKEFLEKYFQGESHLSKNYFLEPVKGVITQEFNSSRGHLGIDYGVKPGLPVYATSGGIITFADYTVDSGNMIIIQHNEIYTSVYKHCSSLLKKTHDIVTQGELIALSGNSGKNTTGPHLHFEIWYKGKAVDPKNLLIN